MVQYIHSGCRILKASSGRRTFDGVYANFCEVFRAVVQDLRYVAARSWKLAELRALSALYLLVGGSDCGIYGFSYLLHVQSEP